jgi:hypothetical protein
MAAAPQAEATAPKRPAPKASTAFQDEWDDDDLSDSSQDDNDDNDDNDGDNDNGETKSKRARKITPRTKAAPASKRAYTFNVNKCEV